MPIYSNFGYGIEIYHKPLPASRKDRDELERTFLREKLKRTSLEIKWEKGFLRLQTLSTVGILVEALGDRFWKRLGKVIKATGEPWWEFCILIVDDREWAKNHSPQADQRGLKKHPHGHALSVIRIHANGTMNYLVMDEPPALP